MLSPHRARESIAGTRRGRLNEGVNDIRNHKDDKAAVHQVALRHRQKMQVQLEDTMSKFNQLAREHADLKVQCRSFHVGSLRMLTLILLLCFILGGQL